MVLMRILFSAMLHWELKILFSVLSCSATEQWISDCHFNITNRWPVSFKNIYVVIANIKGYTSDKTIYTNKVSATNTTVTVDATRNNNFENDIYGFCLGVGKA